MQPRDYCEISCSRCREGAGLGFSVSMAFQPILDIRAGGLYGYEALVRGPKGEGAGTVLSRVGEGNLYRFDQVCRVTAIMLAAQLGLEGVLNINFLPNAIYRPELCIRTTLDAAREHAFPLERICFEITEVEKVPDHRLLSSIVNYYKQVGFLTAIDDFGSGHAGLGLLADFQTDYLKIDMGIIRDLHRIPERRVIVEWLVELCRRLGMRALAEGVESAAEYAVLRDLGVELYQGYLFARPGFESLPEVDSGFFEPV